MVPVPFPLSVNFRLLLPGSPLAARVGAGVPVRGDGEAEGDPHSGGGSTRAGDGGRLGPLSQSRAGWRWG